MSTIKKLSSRWIAAAMIPIVPLITVTGAGTAAAATVYPYQATSSATAVAGTMTATTTITATNPVVAALAGITAVGADGTAYGLPKTANVWLSSTPVTITASRNLPAGLYSYYTSLYVNGLWIYADRAKSIYVPGTPPPGVDNTIPKGNLSGWTQVFSDDFTQNLTAGGFPGSYANKWQGYNGFKDTSGIGTYDNTIISVHDGNLDESLNQSGGVTHVAAPTPLVGGQWGGQTYGRFAVRFKADALPGLKTAFLLWPDSNLWNDGEIDFPEASLNGTMWGYNHCPGNPSVNCTYTDTGVSYGEYHTLIIDWKPNSLSFIIDGRVSKTTTTNVPTKPMHWVLQTEANGKTVTTPGHLLIDWVSIYKYTP